MSRSRTPSSRPFRALRAAPLLALALLFGPNTALATHVTSAGNTPFSGVAPGHVNMATGELILVMRPDLMLDGPMPVVFRRYYASMLAREGLASSRLGTNWLGEYDWSLATGPGGATIVTNRGKRIQFASVAGGGFSLSGPTDEAYRLTLSGGSYRLAYPSLRRVFLFDATSHLLSQVIGEHGNALTLTYVGGRLAQVGDGLGRTLTFGYEAATGFLSSVSDGTRSIGFGHSGSNLATFTDAASGITNYAYAAPAAFTGLLASIQEPLGNAPHTYGYDTSGRVSTLMDAMSHTFSFSYDTPTGNLFSDPLSNTWKFQYDAQDRLMTLTDPANGPTSYLYDPQGRVSSMARPMGDPTSFNYDPASGYVSSMLRAGSLFAYEYLPHSVGGATLFDLSAAHYPDGTNESYTHDPAGNLTDFMDRGGFPWSWTYNGFGEALTEHNPAGGATTFTYDPQARPDTRLDNAGHTAHYTFDSFSRLTRIGWPDGPTRSFASNNLDQLTSITDERGKIWGYAYDDDHRLESMSDPLLHSTQLVWDENDRVGQWVDALGHATVYGYDPPGRLASVTDRTGHTTGFQHDALHRLTGIVNAMSDTWSRSYDADSRLTSWQDPLGHSAVLGYDFLDRVTHVTDAVLSSFDLGYDMMGRLLSLTGPLEAADAYGYDARGLLTEASKSNLAVDYGRTPLGQVSGVTDPDHNAWPVGHDPQGRRTSDADPLARMVGYAYDERCRLLHADLPVGAVTFGYDPASRLTDCQWLDGTALTYTYDDANRLTGATGASFAYDDANRMTSSNGLSIGYDFEGRIVSETYAPGKVVTYGYDNRGLLTTMSDWVGGATLFTYDAGERLIGMTRPNGIVATYSYDAADRLINAVEKNPGPINISEITITRDARGRPASIDRRQPLMPVVTLPASTGFAYDAASQVAGLSYDGLARLTADGARSFVWDGASRLTRYTAGADSPSFTYDAYGRMLSRSLGASSEQYVWNYAHGQPTLDAVYQGAAPRKFYVYAPSGTLLYSIDAATGARLFYHFDEGGNTIFLTTGAGSVLTEYAYTPFGGMSVLGATADNPFTWGGSFGVIQLGQSGLFRVGGSIYDAKTARVVSGAAVNSGINPGPQQAQPGPIQVGANPGPTQSLRGYSGNSPFGYPGNSPLGYSGNSPLDFAGKNPGPIGANPGPIQLDKNPGPIQIGKTPGPSQIGQNPGPIQLGQNPGPVQLDKNPGPVQIEVSPGPSQLGVQPGPIQTPAAFFKSAEGLKVDTEVEEYEEGGIGGSGMRHSSIIVRPEDFTFKTPVVRDDIGQPRQPPPWVLHLDEFSSDGFYRLYWGLPRAETMPCTWCQP